jgi:hypothetical protein
VVSSPPRWSLGKSHFATILRRIANKTCKKGRQTHASFVKIGTNRGFPQNLNSFLDMAPVLLYINRCSAWFRDSLPLMLPEPKLVTDPNFLESAAMARDTNAMIAMPHAPGATSMPVETATINPPVIDQDVVELPLLLPRWQAQVLEAAAARRGMTTGQILRRVITDLFGTVPPNSGQ